MKEQKSVMKIAVVQVVRIKPETIFGSWAKTQLRKSYFHERVHVT